MSKHERKKTATFELEPDGFSIHTFEISAKLSGKDYRKCKDYLYNLNKDHEKLVTYENQNGIICCHAFSDHGLTLKLIKCEKKSDAGEYAGEYIQIVVSPRRLLDPDTSYLGILEPSEESIEEIADTFEEIFQDTPIPNKLNYYILTRVDLCTNIRCSNHKLFREMVRVIHKLPTPPKYQRKLKKTDTKGMNDKKKRSAKKDDNQYNKHYMKVSCDSCDLVIYDKTFQLKKEKLVDIGYDNHKEGVLRFEYRVGRDIIRKLSKKEEIDTTKKMLKYLIMNSEELMIDAFSRYYPEDRFCRMDEIEQMVNSSGYKAKTRELMLELSERMSRGQIMDNVFHRMKKDGLKFDKKELLARFEELEISPIPLWKNFCAKWLPSPVTLLKGISEREIEVKYIIIK